MKKASNILLIMLLAISIILSGCSSKDDETIDEEVSKGETTTKTEKEKDQELDEGIAETLETEEIQLEDQKEEIEEDEKPEGIEGEKRVVAEISSEVEKQNSKEKTTEKVKEKPTENRTENTPKKPIEKPTVKIEDNKKEDNTPENVKLNALKIEGKIKNPLNLSLDELKDMKDILFKGDFYSLNSFGTTAHTQFKGVNLWSLLSQKAKISSDATKVTIIATDGYKMEFSVEQVSKQDYIDETNPEAKLPMIIAWEENGEEYDIDDGVPFKLVVGQREAGDVNKPQWVSNIDKIVVK